MSKVVSHILYEWLTRYVHHTTSQIREDRKHNVFMDLETFKKVITSLKSFLQL